MKKIILTIAISFIAITSVCAQTKKDSSSLKIGTGIMFAPMAHIDIQKPNEGFGVIYPLFAVTSFTKSKTTIVTSYCFNINSVNLFLTYDITPKINPYIVTMKNVKDRGCYTGIGLMTPVANGIASMFIEIGSNWNNLQPALYTGVFIPMKLKIR